VTWTAGVSLFSGRPDPTWPLDDEVAQRLVEKWRALELTDAPVPEAPPLGYRGAFLLAPDGRRWCFHDNVAVLGAERRHDPDRRLEYEVIDTAPAGAIPPE
jgi:hypothetical protein